MSTLQNFQCFTRGAPGFHQQRTRPAFIKRHDNLRIRSGKQYAAEVFCTSVARSTATQTLTQQYFKKLEDQAAQSSQAGGAGGGTTYAALQRMDTIWSNIRNMKEGSAAGPPPTFFSESNSPCAGAVQYDVVVCGGTLGIFIAAALQAYGFRVAVIERGPLRGRQQDWNISRRELFELVDMGLLSAESAESVINIEWNPVRVGFHGGCTVTTRDVLNLGVSPSRLIQQVKHGFVAAGGVVLENTELKVIRVHSNAVQLDISDGKGGPTPLTSRLVIDCMGHMSPVVRQCRWGRKPDGVCLVVGTAGRGFTDNSYSDLLYTSTPINGPDSSLPYTQIFWEAFPAATGPTDRTTYMFTYTDADPSRPSLEDMLDAYWSLMPDYQGVSLEDIEVQRIVFGLFPTFRDSPLGAPTDRMLPLGDASGVQSPLSFGGFGALTRHLSRVRGALRDALETDCLDQSSLSLVNGYSPGVSSTWMMQRAMSVRPGQNTDPQFINKLMSANFEAMQQLGEPVLKPFLQDVIQLGPLAQTMGTMIARDPLSIPAIISHVGVGPVIDWTKHFLGLATFETLYAASTAMAAAIQQLPPQQRYKLQRAVETWKYGAGRDYD